MGDRRRTQRWRAYLGGRASFGAQQPEVDCLIHNISDVGAMLVIDNGQLIPNEFTLAVTQRDMTYRARARWRGPGEIGVELLPPVDDGDAPIPLSLMRRLRQVENENDGLRRRIAELAD